MKGVRVYKQNCDPKEAEDRTLPYICYLISYKQDEKVVYDLAMAGKQTDLFDYYYDLYGKNFIEFKQSEKVAGKDFMSGSHQRVFRQGRTVLEGQKLKQAEQPKQAEEPPKPKKQPKKAEPPKQPPLKDPRPEQGRVLTGAQKERYDKRYTEKMAILMKKNQTLRNQGRVPQSHLAMTKEADEYAMFSGPSSGDEL